MAEQDKANIQAIFGIFIEGGASKYLGLSECFNGSKLDLFAYFKDIMKVGLS